MDIVDKKTEEELYLALLGEIAKARNEVACARGDLDKANSRLSFLLVVVNSLIDRRKIKG